MRKPYPKKCSQIQCYISTWVALYIFMLRLLWASEVSCAKILILKNPNNYSYVSIQLNIEHHSMRAWEHSWNQASPKIFEMRKVTPSFWYLFFFKKYLFQIFRNYCLFEFTRLLHIFKMCVNLKMFLFFVVRISNKLIHKKVFRSM